MFQSNGDYILEDNDFFLPYEKKIIDCYHLSDLRYNNKRGSWSCFFLNWIYRYCLLEEIKRHIREYIDTDSISLVYFYDKSIEEYDSSIIKIWNMIKSRQSNTKLKKNATKEFSLWQLVHFLILPSFAWITYTSRYFSKLINSFLVYIIMYRERK
jgi:hypothetical protein